MPSVGDSLWKIQKRYFQNYMSTVLLIILICFAISPLCCCFACWACYARNIFLKFVSSILLLLMLILYSCSIYQPWNWFSCVSTLVVILVVIALILKSRYEEIEISNWYSAVTGALLIGLYIIRVYLYFFC